MFPKPFCGFVARKKSKLEPGFLEAKGRSFIWYVIMLLLTCNFNF